MWIGDIVRGERAMLVQGARYLRIFQKRGRLVAVVLLRGRDWGRKKLWNMEAILLSDTSVMKKLMPLRKGKLLRTKMKAYYVSVLPSHLTHKFTSANKYFFFKFILQASKLRGLDSTEAILTKETLPVPSQASYPLPLPPPPPYLPNQNPNPPEAKEPSLFESNLPHTDTHQGQAR